MDAAGRPYAPDILQKTINTEGLEARVGIEPTNRGFADLCLTTWLPRLKAGVGYSAFASQLSLFYSPPFVSRKPRAEQRAPKVKKPRVARG